MPPTLDNPAGRLYLLLEEAQNLHGSDTDAQFSKLLNYSPDNIREKLSRIQAVVSALDETEELLKFHAPDMYEIFQLDRASVYNFFTVMLNGSQDWNQYRRGHLKETALRTLMSCSVTLSSILKEKVVSGEQLSELEAQLDALYLAFVDAELPSEFKNKVLSGLKDVKNAIHEYRISGAAGIEKAISTVLVTVSMESNMKQEDKQDLSKKFFDWVQRINAAFILWSNVHPALPHIVGTIRQLAEKAGQ